ncbi:CPBP family glutamic-type intramembrane protease [Aminipila sp.]|uniref:CPBP family glutamic-type intramembrane protease n=1 Tax=Aminipila sp. TaxID=2060095 RepID=UPI0028A2A688|nr:CPBP family glutamic-type intramembrane protease [Aminipila sp.]
MTFKTKLILQIVSVYIFVLSISWISNNLVLNIHDNWIIIITCFLEIALIGFITLKVDKKSLSSVGLLHFSIWDFGHGLILGIVLYLLQILPPILIMKMDISQYGSQFDIYSFLSKLIFLTVTIGFSEELVFRGFIFSKLNQLIKSKLLIILISSILFYCIHLTGTLAINWTHIYSTSITTILFCGYLYLSKKKTILPLLLAHGLYDTLISGYGLIIWNLFSM